MQEFFDRVALRILVTHWGWLPAPLWAVTASPLICWALGQPLRKWIAWPTGASRNPFRKSFWGYPDPASGWGE